MWLTKIGTPVASTNREDRELCDDDGGTDGGCDFFGGLDSKSDMTFAVTNDHDGLEPSSLTSTSLLLDGFDLQRACQYCSKVEIVAVNSYLHHLILELGKEPIDNLVFFDRKGV